MLKFSWKTFKVNDKQPILSHLLIKESGYIKREIVLEIIIHVKVNTHK